MTVIVEVEKQRSRRLVDTKGAVNYLGNSPKILERAVKADWISVAFGSGRGGRNLFDVLDLDGVIERLKRGERPPLLPCEIRQREKSQPSKKVGGKRKGGAL